MNYRNKFIAIVITLSCIALLSFGYYLEYAENLKPCPLCVIQRIIFFLVGLISLLYILHRPKTFGNKIYNLLIFVSSSLGALAAGRQIWLQSLPPNDVPPCIPSFNVMLKYMSYWDVLINSLHGGGDCAVVEWRFLHLSIAQWAMAWFILFAIFAIMGFFQANNKR